MRLWIAAIALVGLAALGLAVLPRAIDWDSYRSDIEAAAATLSGHDMTINGPIQVTLLPRPVMIARDVVMTGKADNTVDFEMTANQAEVDMAIGPLLAGRPAAHNLRLRRPVLTIDDGGSGRLRSWPPRWQDWVAPVLGLDLEAIGIVDGRIELAGDGREGGFSLSDLSLDISIDSTAGSLDAAGLFRTKRHSFTLSADLGRPDGDGVSAARLQIDAQNGIEETTTLRFSGQVKPSGEDRHIRGRVALVGPDLQHGLSAIAAATGYPSTFLSIATAQPFSIDGRIDADPAGIRSDELQLKLSEKLGRGRIDLALHPKTELDLEVELPTLRLADNAGLDDFLPLDILSKLDVPPGSIDMRLREVAHRGEAARQVALKLETGADRITRVEQVKVALPGLVDIQFEGGLIAGALGPELRGQIKAVGDDLGTTLAWLGLIQDQDRQDGWRGLSLESDVEISSVEIALSGIDMRLDSSKVVGRAGLRFAGRQRLTLDLDAERPNLDLYAADWSWRDMATRLARRFRDLDAEIDLSFDRLSWRDVHVEEGLISARAENGRLTFQDIAARTVGDTVLSLDGGIDLEGHTADLDATIESQHPVRALHHLNVALPLTSARPRPLALTGKIAGSLERFRVDVDVDYDGGDAAIDGDAGWIDERPWYDLRIGADHPDHQALAGQFGLAPLVTAGDAEGAFQLEGHLRHEARAEAPWIMSGNTTFGPTSFTGSIAFEDGMIDGPFDAKLSIGSPRRDSLAPLLILSGIRLAGGWTPARWLGRLPRTGLRTAWLDHAAGRLSLTSKGGLAGAGLSMDARLDDGLFYLERLEASPWQGQLMAELTLERRRDQPSASVAIDLDDVDAAELTRWLGVKSGLSGPIDLRLQASGVGKTPYALMASLEGEVAIAAGPGEVEGLGIRELRRALMPAIEGARKVDRSLTLEFESLEAEGELSRGILTIEDGRLVLDPTTAGDPIEARLDGTADLLLWIVDLTLAGPNGEAQTDADPARVYRLVGPPGRPAGVISSGN